MDCITSPLPFWTAFSLLPCSYSPLLLISFVLSLSLSLLTSSRIRFDKFLFSPTLSICLSACLPYLSITVSVSLPLCFTLHFVRFSLAFYLLESFSLSFSAIICLSVCLFPHSSVYPFLLISLLQFPCLSESICLCLSLSVCVSVCVSLSLSLSLSLALSIYIFLILSQSPFLSMESAVSDSIVGRLSD